MNEQEPRQEQPEKLNPSALSVQNMARLLTAAGYEPVTEEMIQAHLDDGAPKNADGTINLIYYAAWLTKEFLDARRSAKRSPD